MLAHAIHLGMSQISNPGVGVLSSVFLSLHPTLSTLTGRGLRTQQISVGSEVYGRGQKKAMPGIHEKTAAAPHIPGIGVPRPPSL